MSSAPRSYTYFPAKQVPQNQQQYFVQQPPPSQQQYFVQQPPPSEHHVQFESYPPYIPSREESQRRVPNELMIFAPLGVGIVCLAFLAILILLIIYGLGSGGYR